jgi:hypothetical protein
VTSTAERRRDDTSRAIETTPPGASFKTDGSGGSRLGCPDDPGHGAVSVRQAERVLFERLLSAPRLRNVFAERRRGELRRPPGLLPDLLQLVYVRENAGELMRQRGKVLLRDTQPGERRDVEHDLRADRRRLGGHADNCKAF